MVPSGTMKKSQDRFVEYNSKKNNVRKQSAWTERPLIFSWRKCKRKQIIT